MYRLKAAKGKVAVIGDRDSLPLFKSAGFHTEEASTQSQAADVIKRLSSMGDFSLVIVLRHILSDEERFKSQVSKYNIPVLILATTLSPQTPVDVNKLIAKMLGMG